MSDLKAMAREMNFANTVACASASVLAQITSNAKIKPHLTNRAAECGDLLSKIPFTLARCPGFFTPVDARSIVNYASEKTSVVKPTIDYLNKRSAALTSIQASPFRQGGRVDISYKIASGDRPLSDHAKSRMDKSIDYLRRSQIEFHRLRAEADEMMTVSAKPNLQLLQAFERVITDSATYLNARNQLAQDGFDVSPYDKEANSTGLLLLAAWRRDLDPIRDHIYRTHKKTPSSPSM